MVFHKILPWRQYWTGYHHLLPHFHNQRPTKPAMVKKLWVLIDGLSIQMAHVEGGEAVSRDASLSLSRADKTKIRNFSLHSCVPMPLLIFVLILKKTHNFPPEDFKSQPHLATYCHYIQALQGRTIISTNKLIRNRLNYQHWRSRITLKFTYTTIDGQ